MQVFLMGWLVYFSQYFGRYNYAASMVAIGQKQGWDTALLGLIASIIFVTYGFGQLFTGWLGDRLNPKAMIFVGCAGSAGCNLWMGLSGSLLQMQLAWGLNGLFCALIWAPMVRLLTVYMPADRLRKSILAFTYATSLGVTGTYLLTSFLVSRFDWRVAFYVPAVIGLVASLGWLAVSFTSGKTPARVPEGERSGQSSGQMPDRGGRRDAAEEGRGVSVGLCAFGAAAAAGRHPSDGAFEGRDDDLGAADDLGYLPGGGLSLHLPVRRPAAGQFPFGLAGQAGSARGHEGDDMRNGALLFLGAVAGMGVLLLAGGLHPLLSVVLFSIISTFVTGTNVILISFVPLQFTAMGRTSTIAGLTNAFTYLGSALSGWGLAGSPGGTAGAWSTGSWRGSAFWAALFAWRRGRCGGGLPKPETPAGPNRNKKEEMRCYPSAETIILWR